MRLFCFECGKSVTNEIPDSVIFRAIAQCPECIDKHSPSPFADIVPLPYCDVIPTIRQCGSLNHGWISVVWDADGEHHSFDGHTKVIAIGRWNQFVMKIESDK